MQRIHALALLITALSTTAAHALPIDISLSHSGYLLDGSDQPVTAQGQSMTFRIYDQDAPVGSQTLIWSANCSVSAQHGYYTALLGSTGCGAGLNTSHIPIDAPRWLEVSVGTTAMLPRMKITSAPTAAVAAKSLDTVALAAVLSDAGVVNTATNPVAWTKLKNVPDDFKDGVDDNTTYTAGGGLALTGTALSVASDGVTNAMIASDAASLAKVSGGAMAASGGNVGIGTSSPSGTLHINSSGNTTLRVDAPLGGYASVGWATNGSIDWQISRPPSSTDLRFNDGISDLLILQKGGNVGIGSTAPAAKLDVAGTVKASTFQGDGSQLTGLPNTSPWSVSGSNTSYGGGNVGIGTAAPFSKLYVASGEAFIDYGSLASGGALRLATNANQAFIGSNHYYDTVGAVGRYARNGGAAIINLDISNGATAGDILFQTAPAGTAGSVLNVANPMVIKQGGNVGIGTTSPIGTLDVRANGRNIIWGHNNPDYRSDIGALNDNGQPYIAFHGLHGTTANTIQRNGTGFAPIVLMHDHSAGLQILGAPGGAANAEVALTPIATFKTSGNVGIGTAEPLARLDVNGNINVNGDITGLTEHAIAAGNVDGWSMTAGSYFLMGKIACVKLILINSGPAVPAGTGVAVHGSWPTALVPWDQLIMAHCAQVDGSAGHSVPCSLLHSSGMLWLEYTHKDPVKGIAINGCFAVN